MRYSDIFMARINCSDSDRVFEYLMHTLKETLTRWDYFVNWVKVFDNVRNVEIDLNILNYLIGKENIEAEFSDLLDRHPSVARLIPVLIACRERRLAILTGFDRNSFRYETYDFGSPESINKRKVMEFAKSTGFLKLLETRRVKNLVDYVIGVEVGLDSNARKNRGGESMETVVEFFIRDICERQNFQYIKSAAATNVRQQWGLELRVDKSSRKVDFAINRGGRLFLIETNFYRGGGSKLKSTAGEYRTMFDFWRRDGHVFIWITDGYGWQTSRLPLQEAFMHVDYILNLDMVSNGLLEDILLQTSV